MTTFFVVWLVLILGLAGLFLVGGALSAVMGSSFSWFLLAAAVLAGAAFLVLKGLERLERLEQVEEQLQSQSRRIQKLETQLEQWKKETSR